MHWNGEKEGNAMMKADILLEKEMILEIRAEEEKEERLKDYLKILERRQEK